MVLSASTLRIFFETRNNHPDHDVVVGTLVQISDKMSAILLAGPSTIDGAVGNGSIVHLPTSQIGFKHEFGSEEGFGIYSIQRSTISGNSVDVLASLKPSRDFPITYTGCELPHGCPGVCESAGHWRSQCSSSPHRDTYGPYETLPAGVYQLYFFINMPANASINGRGFPLIIDVVSNFGNDFHAGAGLPFDEYWRWRDGARCRSGWGMRFALAYDTANVEIRSQIHRLIGHDTVFESLEIWKVAT